MLVEHEVRTVTLALAPDKGPAVSRGVTPAREAPAAPGNPGPTPWFYVGVTTAGVGVVTGTITGFIALSKASAVSSACSGTVCPRSAESDLSTSRTMGTVSTIAFGVAAAGTVVAVVAWLTRPAAATAVSAPPNPLRWTW